MVVQGNDRTGLERLLRRHRHRYHGVLAPNATLRDAVTSRAGQPVERSAVDRLRFRADRALDNTPE